MTTEAQEKTIQVQMYGIECLSQICYWSFINIEYCSTVSKNLPAGKLKDLMIYYQQNQREWLRKIMGALKGYKAGELDLHKSMQQDLDDIPLWVMFAIISDLKRAMDMEGISEVVKEMSELKDASPILTQLKAIIKNEKYKQDARQEN
jgi:hypothetical protein